MNLDDLTPQQDAAFVALRNLHNRDNPADQVTEAQLVQRYATAAFQNAVKELEDRVTGTELRTAYKAASAATQAQVNTLLGL
jgi:hypothetical protein